MTIKARISEVKIPKLCSAARAQYQYAGDKKADGVFWFFDRKSGSGQGHPNEEECRKAIEIRTAFDVLEAAGIEDAHSYDWHLWCDRAEQMVREIVMRDKEARNASSVMLPFEAVINAMARV